MFIFAVNFKPHVVGSKKKKIENKILRGCGKCATNHHYIGTDTPSLFSP